MLAEFAAVAIDHARRFTSSEVRRRDLQRTVDALDATFKSRRPSAARPISTGAAVGRQARARARRGPGPRDRVPARR